MEPIQKIPGRRKIRHGLPENGDGARNRLREFVAIGRHHLCDAARRWHFAWPFVPGRRSFFFSLSGRPFRDNTKTSIETHDFHRPPERGAVMAAACPGRLELCEERIERTHPATEHIGTGAAHDLTNQPARLVGLPHDFLDRHALGRQRENRGVLRLA